MGNCTRSAKVYVSAPVATRSDEIKTEASFPSSEAKALVENPIVNKPQPASEKKPMSRIAMMKAEMKKKQAYSNQAGSSELFEYLLALAQEPSTSAHVNFTEISPRIADESLLRASLLQKDYSGLTIIDHCLLNGKIDLFGFLIDRLDLNVDTQSEFISQLSQTTFKAQLGIQKQFNRNPKPFFEFIELLEKSTSLAILFTSYLAVQRNIINILQSIDMNSTPAKELISYIAEMIEKSIANKRDEQEVQLLESIIAIQKKIKYDSYFKNFILPDTNAELEKDIKGGLLEISLPNISFDMRHSKLETKAHLKSTTFNFTLAHQIALQKKFTLFEGRWESFSSQLFIQDSSQQTAASIILRTAPLETIKQLIAFTESTSSVSKQLLTATNNHKQNVIHMFLENRNIKPDQIPSLIDMVTKNDSDAKEILLEGFDDNQLIPLSLYLRQYADATTTTIELTSAYCPTLVEFLTPSMLSNSHLDQRSQWLSGGLFPLWEFPFLAIAKVPPYIWRLHPQLALFNNRVLALNNTLFESIVKVDQKQRSSKSPSYTNLSKEYLFSIVNHLNLALIPNCLEISVVVQNLAWIQQCLDNQMALDEQRFLNLSTECLSSKDSIKNAFSLFNEVKQTSINHSSKRTQRTLNIFLKSTFIPYKLEHLEFTQPPSALDSIVTIALRIKKNQLNVVDIDRSVIDNHLVTVLKKQSSCIQLLKLKSSLPVFNCRQNTAYHTISKIYSLGNATLTNALKSALKSANVDLESIFTESDIRLQVILLNIQLEDLSSLAKFSNPTIKSIQQVKLLSALRQNYLHLGSIDLPVFIVEHLKFFQLLRGMSVQVRKQFLTDISLKLLETEKKLSDTLSSNALEEFNDSIAVYLLDTLIGIIKEFGFSCATKYISSLPKSTRFRILPRILVAVPFTQPENQMLFREVMNSEGDFMKNSNFIVNLSKQFDAKFYVDNSKSILEGIIGCNLLGWSNFKLTLPPLKLESSRILAGELAAHSSPHVRFFAELIKKSSTPTQLLLENKEYIEILEAVDLSILPETEAILIKNLPKAVYNLNYQAVKWLFTHASNTITLEELELNKCSIPQQRRKDQDLDEFNKEIDATSREQLFLVIHEKFPEEARSSIELYEYLGAFVSVDLIKSDPTVFSLSYIDLVSLLERMYRKRGQLSRQRTESVYTPFSNPMLAVIFEQFLKSVQSHVEADIDAAELNLELVLNEKNRMNPTKAEKSLRVTILDNFKVIQEQSDICVQYAGLQLQLINIGRLISMTHDDTLFMCLIPIVQKLIKADTEDAPSFIDGFLLPYYFERQSDTNYPKDRLDENTSYVQDIEVEITHLMEAACRSSNEQFAIRLLAFACLFSQIDLCEIDAAKSTPTCSFHTKISRRIGQPKPDPFDAIITTYENHKSIAASRYLSDYQFRYFLTVVRDFKRITIMYKDQFDKKIETVLTNSLETIAYHGSAQKWHDFITLADLTEPIITSNKLFSALAKSIASMIIMFPRSSTKQEQLFHCKMGSIISASLCQLRNKHLNPTPAQTTVTREDFQEIQFNCIDKLDEYIRRDELLPFIESEAELADKNSMKATLFHALVETIPCALLSDFDIGIELASIFLATKTYLTHDALIKLTYKVLLFGPLSTASLWSQKQFSEYLEVFGEVYLALLENESKNVNKLEEAVHQKQVGALIGLHSQNKEMNELYLDFLVQNQSRLSHNQLDHLAYIVSDALLNSSIESTIDSSKSKKYLLQAMHSLSLTFTSEIHRQKYGYFRNAPFSLNNYKANKMNETMVEKTSESAGLIVKYLSVLSDSDIEAALELNLFSLDQEVVFDMKKSAKGSFLRLDESGKISAARYLITLGKYDFIKNNVAAVVKAAGGDVEICARDALISGRLDLFTFLLDQIAATTTSSAAAEAIKLSFVEKQQLLFDLVRHTVGNKQIFSYLLTNFYFEPKLYLRVSHVIENDSELLKNLIIMHEESILVDILQHVLSQNIADDKANLMSALIRVSGNLSDDEDIELVIKEEQWDMSVVDLLQECHFYEALCLLHENGIEGLNASSQERAEQFDSILLSRYHNTKLADVNLSRSKLFASIFRLFVHVRDQLTELATSLSHIAMLEQLLFNFYRSSPFQHKTLDELFEEFVNKQFLGGIYTLAEIFPQIDINELVFKNKKLQRSEMFNIYLLKRTVYPDIDFIALNNNDSSAASDVGRTPSACAMTLFMVTLTAKNLQTDMQYMKSFSPEIDTSKQYSQDSKEATLKQFIMKAYYMKQFIQIIGQRDKQLLLNDDEILSNIILQDPKLAIDLLKDDQAEQQRILDRFRTQIKDNQDEYLVDNPLSNNNELNLDEIDQGKNISASLVTGSNDSPFNKVLRAIIYYFDVRSSLTIQEVYQNVFSDIVVSTKQGISFQYHLTIAKAANQSAGDILSDAEYGSESNITEENIRELALSYIMPRLFSVDAALEPSAYPTIDFATVFADLAELSAKKHKNRCYSTVFESIFNLFQTLFSLRLLEGNEDKTLAIRLVRGEGVVKVSEITQSEVSVDVFYSISQENQLILHCDDLSAAKNEINSFYFVHRYLPQIMQQLEQFDERKNTLIPPSLLGKISLEFDYASIDHLPLEQKQLVLAQTNFIPASQVKQSKKKNNKAMKYVPSIYDSNLYFGLFSLFQEIASNIAFLNENPGEFYSINDMFAPNNSATMNPTEQHSHPSLAHQSESSNRQDAQGSTGQSHQHPGNQVLDKVKMQGAIIQYYLEQLPDNTYKLRPRKNVADKQERREELYFSEFYTFTPLSEGTMEIVYLSPEDFLSRTSPTAIYDTILSQLYAYEQNFTEQLRQSQEDVENEIKLRSAHKWYYTIKITPAEDSQTLNSSPNKKLDRDAGSSSKASRIIWANELFVGYNILHIKQMLRYFQREVEFGKPHMDGLNQNWKMNCVSLFEVVLSGMTRIARASTKASCESFGFDPDSIFGILKHVLSSPMLFKLIRVILYNNLANAGNIMKVIKGFYFEFSEIDVSELPSASADSELADCLSHGLDQIVRFGRTEYYIQKHMLVIRLNVAFVVNSMDELKARAVNLKGVESEVLKNYIRTAANGFDFYEQLFSSEQIVCQILNKLEIDNHMLELSKALSSKYSQSIMLNINYESLFALFKAEIAGAKLVKDPILQIARYETVWKGLENIRNYFMNDFDRIINRQLGKQSFQDLFSMIFINLIYAFENKQRISKRLFSNFRSYPVLVSSADGAAVEASNKLPDNNADDEDELGNDEEADNLNAKLNGQRKSTKLLETLLLLDGACQKFENTFLIQMNLSEFIQQIKSGDECLIGYSNKSQDYCYKLGTVVKKSNVSISLGKIYQGTYDNPSEIAYDKISFVMKSFKNWPNPAIFKAEIVRYAIIDQSLKVRLINSKAIQEICHYFMQDSTERDQELEQEYGGYLFRGSENISSEISLNNLIQLMPSTISLYFESDERQNNQMDALQLGKQRSYQQQQVDLMNLNEQQVVLKLNESLKFKNPEINPGKLSFASQIDSNMYIYEEQLNLVASLQSILSQYLYQSKGDSLRINFDYDSAFEECRYQYMDQFQKNISLICVNITDAFMKYIESPELSDEIETSFQLHASEKTSTVAAQSSHLLFNEMNISRFLMTKIFLKHVEIIQLNFQDFPAQGNQNLQFMSYDADIKCIYIHLFIGKIDSEIILPSVKDIQHALYKQIILCELAYLSSSAFKQPALIQHHNHYTVNQNLHALPFTCDFDLKEFTQENHIANEKILLNLASLEFLMTEYLIDSTLKHGIRPSKINATLTASGDFKVTALESTSELKIVLGLNPDTPIYSIIDSELKKESVNYFSPSSFISLGDFTNTDSSTILINQRIQFVELSETDIINFNDSSQYKVHFVDLTNDSYTYQSQTVLSASVAGQLVKLTVDKTKLVNCQRMKYVVYFKDEVISSNFYLSNQNAAIQKIRQQPNRLNFFINQPITFIAQAANPLSLNSTKFDGLNLSINMKAYDVAISLKTYASRYQEFINNNQFLHLAKAVIKKNPVVQNTSYRADFHVNSRYITKDTILVSIVNPKAQTLVIKNSDFANVLSKNDYVHAVCEDNITVEFYTNSKICINRTMLIGSIDVKEEVQKFNIKKQKKNEWIDSDLTLKKVFQTLHISQKKLQVRWEDFSYIESESDLKRMRIGELQNQIKSQEGQHVFFSRAGEVRREIIQFFDGFGNAIDLNDDQLDTYEVVLCNNVFQQIAFKAKIIKYIDRQYLIEWRPLVKGSYKLFINHFYVPQSEDHIGVTANVIDTKSIRVVHSLPEVIPFFEQIECQIYLRDQYGNIYSDFDKTRSKDKMQVEVIEVTATADVDFVVKLSQINKDGKQSILMSFESSQAGMSAANIKDATILLQYDQELLATLNVAVQGLNFEKRKKLFYESIAKYKKNHLSTTIEINRDRFAEDLLVTFRTFDMKNSMYVVFKGERGVDGGGLKREFYELVGKMIKDVNYKFFEVIKNAESEKIFFHPQCLKGKQSLAYFSIFGKFLAHSILHQSLLGVDFCEPVFKLLGKQQIHFSDLKSIIDKPTYDNYCYLKTLDDESLAEMCQYFQVIENGKLVNLIPNGDKQQVDPSNLKQYLDLTAKHYIQDRYEAAVQSLIEGFESVFPIDMLMKTIRPHEISYLTCGVKEITGALLQKMTKFEGGNSVLINFFQRYLIESESSMLSNFLKFISGSSSIPYEHSSVMLRIMFISSMGVNRLPISHTCFLSIEVPFYKTYEQMKNKFDLAFAQGNEGFAFG